MALLALLAKWMRYILADYVGDTIGTVSHVPLESSPIALCLKLVLSSQFYKSLLFNARFVANLSRKVVYDNRGFLPYQPSSTQEERNQNGQHKR